MALNVAKLIQQNNALSAQYAAQAAKANAQVQAYNSAEALKERQWSEMMSSTAHQREVFDLQKAGLNPVLSAYSGGASAYSGATASSDNAYASLLGSLASAALQATSSLAATLENNSTAVKTANIGAKATKYSARVGAKAQKSVAKTNAKSQQKVARINQKTAKYTADQSYKATVAGATISANGQKAVAKISGEYGLDKQRMQNFVEQYKAQLKFVSDERNRKNEKVIAMRKTLTEAAVSIFNTTQSNATKIVQSLIGIVDIL